MKIKAFLKKAFWFVTGTVLNIVLLAGILGLCFNGTVIWRGAPKIVSAEEAQSFENADCILVLGCSVKPDGNPSDMLRDRIETGVALYKAGVAPKILMSGDHLTKEYDEVGTMKRVAVSMGVPPEDIFMDHAGICTYDSIVRAKRIFGVEKMVVVTQKYHLYRALFIAESYGLDCVGVPADLHTYRGQTYRDIRELFGRCKDYLITTLRFDPAYLGDEISLDGDGGVTDDTDVSYGG